MWYFELNGSQQGPESTDQIFQRLQSGQISHQTLMWCEGMEDWLPLSQVPGLESAMNTPAANQAQAPQGASPYQAPQHMQGVPGAAMNGIPRQNGLALTSMILGICSIVLTFGCGIGFILGIPAVITGHIAKKQMKEDNLQTGDGMALAGLIIGYIVIGLAVVTGVVIGLAFASGSSSFSP